MPRNKKLAQKYRGLPCVICGNPGNGDHILNYKGWATRDADWNLWSLCFSHHREKTDHKKGLYGFVNEYGLEGKLLEREFYFIYESSTWWHEKA